MPSMPSGLPRSCCRDPVPPLFGISPRQIGRRVQAAAQAAGLGEGFTGHSGRVGMAQDLAATGVELPALMTAGWWKSSKMPARYTERQASDRGAVGQVLSGKRKLMLQEAASDWQFHLGKTSWMMHTPGRQQ